MKQFCIGLLVCFSFVLNAQIINNVVLDSVEVTNNRITQKLSEVPKAIKIITAAELKSAPAQSFAEALQYVAGIDIRRRGPLGVQSDISIRGGSFDQVLILINGVRMNDAQTGHHTLYLPVEILDIERVEITKGPAARTYGQNAFSGAVNIVTKVRDENGVNASLAYGSFNTLQASLSGGFITNNKKLKQNLALNYSNSDGYDYNRDFTAKSLFYQGQLHLGSFSTLDWFSGGSSRKFGANGFYALPIHRDQYEEVSTAISAISLKNIFDKWSLTSRISHRWNDDYYEFVRNNPQIFNNKTTGNRYTADLNASVYNKLGTLGLGVEMSFETLKSLGLGNHERNILSAFAEQKIVIYEERLKIIPGVFINKFSDRKVQIFPGLDLSYQLSKRAKVYGGINYANRIPTYTDLYYRSSVERGNADLVSESVRSFEIGAEMSKRYGQLKIAAYKNYTENLIDWTKNAVNDQFWIARNYVAANFTGLELSGALNLSELTGGENAFGIDVNASFISAESANDDNQYITRYQFNHIGRQLTGTVKKGFFDNNLNINLSYRLIDRVGEDLDPITKSNLLDVNLLDAAIMYNWKHLSLKYTVNNITNQSYKEINNVLMPGRWHQVQLNYML